MGSETVNTVVVGGGQAGIAASLHLARRNVPHVVLERARIAEAWRSFRWDSLVANGPAWHDRFPDKEFDDVPGDGFASKQSVARYFEDLVAEEALPVRTGVTVQRAVAEGSGFRVDTDVGSWHAANVVAATGPYQTPVIPPVVPAAVPVDQIHSQAYRNPESLAPGAVLVVGAGSSGAQIADELLRSGRKVFLSVGPHERPPRRYRGRDYCYWLGALGIWTATTPPAGREHVTISVSGAHGGETVDFRRFAARGMVLLGMAEACDDAGKMTFRRDLARHLLDGDKSYLDLLEQIDAHVATAGMTCAPEPEAKIIGPTPSCVVDPVLALDLAE